MEGLVGYIATGAVSLAVGLLLRSLEPKSKIVWWQSHNFRFNMREPNLTLHTHSYTIQNLGRKLAENVEVVHRSRPDHFQLQPALDYQEVTTPNGEHILRVPNLGPKEFCSIEFLSYKTLPELLYVRSAAGHGELINILPFKWAKNGGQVGIASRIVDLPASLLPTRIFAP